MAETVTRETVVDFDRVFLGFDGKAVLEGISFQLQRGETKIILGASGSGKSVLLKLTLGLLQPDAGRIFVLGQEISSLREEQLFPIRQRFGMVFQEGALFDSLTVGENVAYALERLGELGPEESERRVREALRFVELEHTLEQFPSELSGGMRRRVAIARAMVSKPEIMLYDSPTAGLDPITAHRIIELVIKQRDVHQVSSLLVTHRLQDAFELASWYFDPGQQKLLPVAGNGGRQETHTRFLVLREGEVAFHGPLEELVAQRDPYLQKFLA
ncbi:MAG: ATP-binding cassette domain-containing protein [Acidobacteria bacterium]|nr:ATP-binding cassette domain-containing protein [Acidobacteriota bacterium]